MERAEEGRGEKGRDEVVEVEGVPKPGAAGGDMTHEEALEEEGGGGEEEGC